MRRSYLSFARRSVPRRLLSSGLGLFALLFTAASCTPLRKPIPEVDGDQESDGATFDSVAGEAGAKRPPDAGRSSSTKRDAGTPPEEVRDATAAGAGSDEPSSPPADDGGAQGAMSNPVAVPGSSAAVKCPSGACTPGGTCTVASDDFSCTCGSGYAGTGTKSCRKIDYCRAGVCGSAGTCVEGATDYSCSCGPGFSGSGTKSCAKTLFCRNDSCGTGGACVEGTNDYSCSCSAGYSGTGTKLCTKITYCTAGACEPAGTCIEEVADFRCSCDLESPDPKSCPYVRRADTIFDATTNLTWQNSYGPYYMRATAVDAEAYCAMTPGWRWATLAEVMKIPSPVFSPPGLCHFTPSGRYCPAGADPMAETFKVHCVH